jgi:hypothetical protein
MSRKPNSLSALFIFTVLALCLLTVNSAAAQTQPCPDLTSVTGQPGWMLVSGPGISVPKIPVNVSPYPGWKSPALPGSSWVSTDANHGSVPGAAGNFTYEYTFCLCRDGKQALSLSFYADNGATVYLNNTQIFTTTGSYNFNGAAKVVNYSWNGGPGTNKVRIVVHNEGGPTGLNAALKITGATTGTCCSNLNAATGQPGWMLVSGPGISVPKVPVTVTPYPGWKNPPLPGSSWVSVDANQGSLPGNYTYEFTFCLCRDGKHELNLSFFADNGATVYLNNTQIFATSGDYNFKPPVQVVNYGWVGGAGTNKVRIVVRNAGGPTGLDAVLSITGATNLGCQVKTGPAGSIRGRVVDPNNAPVGNVEVSVPGRSPVLTNSKGEFELRDLTEAARLAVSFSAPGFMNTTKIYQVGKSPGNGTTIVVWPRAKPIPLDAARGGTVRFSGGGGLTIPPNSLVDVDGRPVGGKVMVSLTQLDVSDRNQLRTMAGDFSARMADKSIRMLESFGVFEVVVTDARGRRANLARGTTARFDMPLPCALRGKVPKRTLLFSFDTAGGLWIEQGAVELTDPLVYSGTINNFDGSLWNTDNPLDVTCITVKFIDVFGANTGPIANAYVKAEGVNYNAISSGYTNNDGLVCLLVKINSPILIYAEDPAFPGIFIGPTSVTSPNIISGAADCGDPNLCPLIMTMEQDARLVIPNTDEVMTTEVALVRRHPVRAFNDNVVRHFGR